VLPAHPEALRRSALDTTPWRKDGRLVAKLSSPEYFDNKLDNLTTARIICDGLEKRITRRRKLSCPGYFNNGPDNLRRLGEKDGAPP
jgi:hypothetical protein